MIESILLVDDENLFHLVFEDACALLDMALSLESLNSSDEADALSRKWFVEGPIDERPECVFVDLNIIGSSLNGIDLIRKINFEYGNGVVVGIISSSREPKEIEEAKKGRYTKESEDLDFSKSGNPKPQKSVDKKTPKKK